MAKLFSLSMYISDDINFELPQMMAFVHDGQFQSTRFAFHVAVRPWLWLKVARLARNTRLASENLCAWLRESALTNTILPETIHNAGGAPRRPQL